MAHLSCETSTLERRQGWGTIQQMPMDPAISPGARVYLGESGSAHIAARSRLPVDCMRRGGLRCVPDCAGDQRIDLCPGLRRERCCSVVRDEVRAQSRWDAGEVVMGQLVQQLVVRLVGE